MEFSICITTLNDAKTVRDSLDSILSQLPEESEVVVVDAGSTDGQLPILERYAAEGRIRLAIHKGCTRGRGRQIALQLAKGDNIISGLDTDDRILPGSLQKLVERYVKGEGLPIMKAGTVYIGKRGAVESIGWKDLYAGEDADFEARAREKGLLEPVDMTLQDSKVMRTYKRFERFRHHVRLFWAYAGIGITPVTSWKSRWLWVLIKTLRKLSR